MESLDRLFYDYLHGPIRTWDEFFEKAKKLAYSHQN